MEKGCLENHVLSSTALSPLDETTISANLVDCIVK